MTVIFSKVSKRFVIQVSDRLVTKKHDKFDELANKSIIFGALNGILSISFTGHAFIGKAPTDQWLSEMLIGRSFLDEKKPPAFGYLKPKFVHIGPALNILRESLGKKAITQVKSEFKDNWINSPFYLSIAGWLWDSKGKFRPIIGMLGKPSGVCNFELKWNHRHWFAGNKFTVSGMPSANYRKGTVKTLVKQLSDKNIDDAEKILADTIRDISHYNRLVGPDCMSILIPPPPVTGDYLLRIRYNSKREASAALVTGRERKIIKIAFTPWMIGPCGFSSPSIVSGNAEIKLGFYRFIIDAPHDPQIGGIISSLERPKI